MTNSSDYDFPDAIPLVVLDDKNQTWEGTIHLDNSSLLSLLLESARQADSSTQRPIPPYDPNGAGAFSIAVLSLYGITICLLAMYHVFKTNKIKEDIISHESEKELDRYLEEIAKFTFQRDTEKENIRRCKRSFLHRMNQNCAEAAAVTNTEDEGGFLSPVAETETENSDAEQENVNTPLLPEGLRISFDTTDVFMEDCDNSNNNEAAEDFESGDELNISGMK